MTRHRGPKKPPAAKKPPLTHFLCVPLVTPTSRETLAASLKRFGDTVSFADTGAVRTTSSEGDAGHQNLRVVHPKAIRPVGAIHLTLGVMSLDKDQLSGAMDYLNSGDVRNLISTTINGSSAPPETDAQTTNSEGSSALERPITPPPTKRHKGLLEVQLQGTESMHAPHKTSILYIAPTDTSGRLYPFCVALQKLFRDKGFLVEDNRPLKLHATIVNTIYAKDRKRPQKSRNTTAMSSGGTSSKDETARSDATRGNDEQPQAYGVEAGSSSRTIDATAILEAFKDFVWADNVILDRVAICEMGAKKIFDEDGVEVAAEYAEVATVSLSG